MIYDSDTYVIDTSAHIFRQKTILFRRERKKKELNTNTLFVWIFIEHRLVFQNEVKKVESDLVAQNEEKNRRYHLLISFSKSTLLDYQLKFVFPLIQEMICFSSFPTGSALSKPLSSVFSFDHFHL